MPDVASSFPKTFLRGLIVDGLGGAPFPGEISIEGDTITSVIRNDEFDPAARFVIAPGFIDIHSHADHFLLVDSSAASKIAQGVTLDVIGNCGYSAAPLNETMAARRRNGLARYGLEPVWRSFDEYLTRLEDARPALNVATLVGHGTLRTFCGIPEDRAALADERRLLRRATEEALAAGAIGVSSGLFYSPGRAADEEELAAILELVAERNGLYAAHLRDEGAGVLEALEEALRVVRRTGVRFEYSHVKAWGRSNWPRARRVIEMIRAAIREGLPVAADVYPYTTAATTLAAGLGLAAPTADRATIEEILHARARCDAKWAERIRILGGFRGAFFRGAALDNLDKPSLSRLSRAAPKPAPKPVVFRRLSSFDDPVGAVRAALVADPATSAAFHELSEANLRSFLREPWVAIGSDASNRAFSGALAKGPAHPRAFGTFPRVLGRYVRDLGLLTLEEAVRRMTSLPAKQLGITDRGRIAPGMKADLVLFDPDVIADVATFRYGAPPRGIIEVWVNGERVMEEGRLVDRRPGRVLRRA